MFKRLRVDAVFYYKTAEHGCAAVLATDELFRIHIVVISFSFLLLIALSIIVCDKCLRQFGL